MGGASPYLHNFYQNNLVIVRMDADSEVRACHLGALVGGDTGGGAYTDLINGPMDHGRCNLNSLLKF